MRRLIFAALALLGSATAAVAAPSPSESNCNLGIYRLADGTTVDIAPTDDDRLRWRRLDGAFGRLKSTADDGWTNTTGLTDRADPTTISFGACDEGRISFGGKPGKRLALVGQDTTFQGVGEALYGRLVLPEGKGPFPVVVLVHGSEANSAVVFNYRQRQYAAEGVGVFVYDKRGTGRSTGKYSQDFHLLAGDAAAALTEARRLAGARASRVGFEGGSQGGWVAPLAATRVKADFVIVGFGLAEDPLAENREETLMGLREKGWGPDVMVKAREVTDAVGVVMASRFKRGLPELETVKAKYGAEPWFKDLQGEFTGDFVRTPIADLARLGA